MRAFMKNYILAFFFVPFLVIHKPHAKSAETIENELTGIHQWVHRYSNTKPDGYVQFKERLQTYIKESGFTQKEFIGVIFSIVEEVEPNREKWQKRVYDEKLTFWWEVLAACEEPGVLQMIKTELLKAEPANMPNLSKKNYLLHLALLNVPDKEGLCRQIVSKEGVFVYLRYVLFFRCLEGYMLRDSDNEHTKKVVTDIACTALKTEYNYSNLIQEDEFLIRLHGEKYENNIQRINFLKQRIPQTELPRHGKESTLMQNNINGKLKDLSQTKQLYDHNLLECLRDDSD